MCVFQVLKRHYARYTPEYVERVCGVPAERFLAVAEALCANSGPERTSAICLRGRLDASHDGRADDPGGVDHPAAARQHRPPRRRHPRPARAREHPGLDRHPDAVRHPARLHPDAAPAVEGRPRRVRGEERAVDRGVGRAGDVRDVAAEGLVRRRGDRGQRLRLRLAAEDRRRPLALRDADAHDRRELPGVLRASGQNPAVGLGQRGRWSARRCATSSGWWSATSTRSRRRRSGTTVPSTRAARCARRTSGPRCSSCPQPRTPRRTARSPTRSGCCSGTTRRSSRPEDCRSDLWFIYHLGRRIREKLAGSARRATAPLRALTWDYPTQGPTDEPDAEAVLQEINGRRADGTLRGQVPGAEDDGSTTCGSWIHAGIYADGVNQTARRKPAHRAELDRAGVGLGVAVEPPHPLQPRLGQARRHALVGAQALRLVGRRGGQMDVAGRRPRLHRPTRRPTTCPREDATGMAAIRGTTPFIAASRRPRLALRAERPRRRPAAHALRAARVAGRQRRSTASMRTRPGSAWPTRTTPTTRRGIRTGVPLRRSPPTGSPSTTPRAACRARCPTCPSCSPSCSCEVSPELAAERGLEHARLGDDRHRALGDRGARDGHRPAAAAARRRPRRCTRSACPTTGAPTGWSRATRPTSCSRRSLDLNIHISEYKAATCDIRPGRRPRGPRAAALVEDYRRGAASRRAATTAAAEAADGRL